jgi:hypothetical protein
MNLMWYQIIWVLQKIIQVMKRHQYKSSTVMASNSSIRRKWRGRRVNGNAKESRNSHRLLAVKKSISRKFHRTEMWQLGLKLWKFWTVAPQFLMILNWSLFLTQIRTCLIWHPKKRKIGSTYINPFKNLSLTSISIRLWMPAGMASLLIDLITKLFVI